MQTRLSSVQHMLMALLAAAFVIGLVARPAPTNGRMRRALAELENYSKQFDRARVEQALLESAAVQGRRPLTALAAAASGKGVPAVQVANPAAVVQPLATLQLRTLAEVQSFAQPQRTLPLGALDEVTLGKALAWRLARDARLDTPVLLEAAELVPAQVTAADLTLEADIAQLRVDRVGSAASVATASEALTAAEQLYENRKKWKMPWKVLAKTNEARKEAKATLEDKQRDLRKLDTRYNSAVQRSQQPHAALAVPPIPPRAIARVTLSQAGKKLTYDIPTKLSVQDVPVQSLQGAELAETQAAGLWDEVRNLDAPQAITAVRAHFNWHYRYVELLGIKVGGMTVLQLLPCALPLLIGFSLLRMNAVEKVYNPFTMQVNEPLPRVGFGSRVFDALVLLVLPLIAAGCAVTSLVLVGQVPALPMLTAAACLGLGVLAFRKLGELQSLLEDVVRTHSNPPRPEA